MAGQQALSLEWGGGLGAHRGRACAQKPLPGSRHNLGMGAGMVEGTVYMQVLLQAVPECQHLPTGCESGLQLPAVGRAGGLNEGAGVPHRGRYRRGRARGTRRQRPRWGP